SLHRELWLLVKAGLSPIEALRAATSIPAEKFKIEGRGRIKSGMKADLLLINGDPSADITATRNIFAVWKDGRQMDREKYLEEAKKDRDAASLPAPAPAPECGELGLISDFEGEKIDAKFGAGWIISTDAMRGGKSTAEMKLVAGGAQGSRKSLLITGTIVAETVLNWAGALFSPGKTMMAPADLSSKKSISFWARGDGRRYAVMIFTRSLGFVPSIQSFTAGPEWEEFIFTFDSFRLKGDDIMSIFIGASGEKGEFALQIDNVSLG
ncbi:MAG: CIA30 family protein, partial [Acidobacteriota bacterium]